MRLPLLFGLAAGLIATSTIGTNVAKADPRPFTFVYDTYAVGKGNVEYEQWATFEHAKPSDEGSKALRLRHEFEFGLADNFDLSVYVASWRYEDSKEFTGTQFESTSVEGILYLSNPVTDFVGVGLYGEVAVGEDALEFELKLLLHKDIGKWTFAYNLVLETEIEGVFNKNRETEVDGVLEHDFGISYAVTPQFRVGGEAVVESAYQDWDAYEGTVAWAGPNISYLFNEHAWVTFSPLYQLTNEEDEPKFNARVIFGYQF